MPGGEGVHRGLDALDEERAFRVGDVGARIDPEAPVAEDDFPEDVGDRLAGEAALDPALEPVRVAAAGGREGFEIRRGQRGRGGAQLGCDPVEDRGGEGGDVGKGHHGSRYSRNAPRDV